MNSHRAFLLFLILSFFTLILSCTDDEMMDDPGLDPMVAYIETEIAYGNDPLQTYDLYLPAGRSESDTDVIVLIHGGGWTGGDKVDVAGIVDLLQETMPDHAVINMNYRLDIDPTDLFGDHLADVESVVRQVADQNEDWQVSEEMIMAGVSAGGHMTLQYAYDNNVNDYVKVACNIVGPTYFLDPAYTMTTVPTHAATLVAIVAFTQVALSNAEYYDAVSPLKVATANAVPTIQFHGDMDPLIPVSQGQLLADRLNELNVPNELIIYEGEGHGWSDLANWTVTAVKFKAFVEANMD